MKKVSHIPAILFAVTFLFLNTGLYARHIIGGTMSYKVSPASPGFKAIQISLRLVRDCSPASGGAYFDNPAYVAIYKGTYAVNALYQTYEVNLGTIEYGLTTTPSGIFLPGNICEETGEYIISDTLPELLDGESYFVVYQRCCKSLSFVNIADPENVGLTLYIELTALAMTLDNNSPVFQNSAGVIACAHDTLLSDRSVIEPDNDMLVYQLSSLISGGGNILTDPGYSTCEGAAPNPPCGPPFGLVAYNGVEYSSGQPLGNNFIVLYNLTGLLASLPQQIGNFLVGEDVNEYRNGQLLSTVHSEFAVYVFDCLTSTTEFDDFSEVITAPNPSANSILISTKNAAWDNADYVLKNLTGASIQKGQLNGGNATITRGGLPAGVYLLEMVAKDGRRRLEKVVFQ